MKTGMAALGVGFVLMLGACSSGGGGTSSSSPPDASGTPTTTGTPSPGPTSGSAELVGTWTADASQILAANTANLGGSGAVTCRGPIVMTFNPDGTYSRRGSVTCSVRGRSMRGAVSTAGHYAVEGNVLTISRTRLEGDGPVPDAWGDGAAQFSVAGPTLNITFSNPSVGTVTQQYTRS